THVTIYIHCACVKLHPPLTFFLVYSPPLLVRSSGEEHMAETEQVRANYSNEEEESPEPETSRSQRRQFKASNMPFVEMVEMVDILKRTDYEVWTLPQPQCQKGQDHGESCEESAP
ncbi:hypothetical protein AB205_0059900, partial [Aquarana catesbeiana]